VRRRGELRADDQQHAATDGDADRVRRHTRHVDDDLQARGRFKDVDRRAAFRIDLEDAGNFPIQLGQQLAGVVGQLAGPEKCVVHPPIIPGSQGKGCERTVCGHILLVTNMSVKGS